MIKDLPLVLILIIADQILNGLCRFIGKLYILILTFLKYLSEKGKSFGLTLSRIKWLWNPAQFVLLISYLFLFMTKLRVSLNRLNIEPQDGHNQLPLQLIKWMVDVKVEDWKMSNTLFSNSIYIIIQ